MEEMKVSLSGGGETVMNFVTDAAGYVVEIIKKSGARVPCNNNKIRTTIERACIGLKDVSIDLIEKEALKNLKETMTSAEIESVLILATSVFIEKDPQYNIVASRLLRQKLYKEVLKKSFNNQDVLLQEMQEIFCKNIFFGMAKGFFDKRLEKFDLALLSKNLKIERDDLLGFMGMHTLHERYFLKIDGQRIETPQAFWMRIAMGLAINEQDYNHAALDFYEQISNLRYLPSTPTLFHSGFVTAQLSSCFLSTVEDDLSHIFKCIGDNAQLAKWAGGIGTDWTNIRGTGSYIKVLKLQARA